MKKIALIEGGKSLEREISLKTSLAFQKAFQKLSFDHTVLEADDNIFVNLKKGNFDLAVLALHGRYGEDGTAQALCEYLKIPYTGPGVLASAICMDKLLTKKICKKEGILTASFEQIYEPKTNLSFPLVLKAAREGSSLGIFICHSQKELEKTFDKALEFDKRIFVEEFILGQEIAISMLDSQIHTAIEIRPQDGFYDYKRKYTKGLSEYIVPARVDQKILEEMQSVCLKIWDLFSIRGFCRMDFIVSKETRRPYLLEVNTLPGMTELSLLPQALAYDKVEFPELVRKIVSLAGLDNEKNS